MTDKLIERIKADGMERVLTIYEQRILSDANIIKAVDELADAVETIELCEDGANMDRLHDEFVAALAAYRAAVSERDG